MINNIVFKRLGYYILNNKFFLFISIHKNIMAGVLYVDDRERAIINLISQSCPKKVERLTCGDYAIAIQQPGSSSWILKAVIERKTLDDYGASLKDGRHYNVQNLINARKDTGCDIHYLIEGPLNPPPDREFAGIPYKNIESSIRNLKTRYGIIITHRQDQFGTAAELEALLASYMHVQQDGSYETSRVFTMRCDVMTPLEGAFISSRGGEMPISRLVDMMNAHMAQSGETISFVTFKPNVHNFTKAGIIEDVIKGAVERTVADDIREARLSITGIGQASLQQTLHLSIQEIVNNPYKVLNGFSKGIKSAYVNFVQEQERQIIFLAAIGGISKVSAKSLLAEAPFEHIVNMSPANLARLKIRKTANGPLNNLGPVLAKKIYDVVTFKIVV